MQAVACERLQNKLSNDDQTVCQATNISQPAEKVIRLSHDHEFLLGQIYFKTDELVQSSRILAKVFGPSTYFEVILDVGEILCLILLSELHKGRFVLKLVLLQHGLKPAGLSRVKLLVDDG